MKRRSWLRAVVAVLIALPVLGIGGLVIAAELRARRLSEPLVNDAARLAAFIRERGEGDASACIARALDTAPDVSRDLPALDPAIRGVRDGVRPLDALPALALSALARHDPWLREAIACSGSLRALPGVGPLASPLHPRRQALPRLQEAAGALAPLRVRVLVAHQQPDEAVDLCLGALSLASDLLWLEGPEASLGALGQVNSLSQPCAEAVWHTTKLEAVEARLASLEQDLPPYSHVMELERVSQQLRLFGAFVTPAQRARLPVGAQVMVDTAASLSRPRHERVALANWWSSAEHAFRGVIAAADLDEPVRSREVLAAQRGFESMWLSLVRVPLLDVRYHLYASSHEVLALAVETLRTAAALRSQRPFVPKLLDVKVVGSRRVLAPRRPDWVPWGVTLPERELE